MKTSFAGLMSSVLSQATRLQKWGFALFFAAKFMLPLAAATTLARGFTAIPSWIPGTLIATYGALVWSAVGVAVYDHYTHRLQMPHWEFERLQAAPPSPPAGSAGG